MPKILDELINRLDKYPKSKVYGKHLGCDMDITIRTTSERPPDSDTSPERVGWRQYHVPRKEVFSSHVDAVNNLLLENEGRVCYVRVMPEVTGESGCLAVRTRLQFGDADKVITQEEWDGRNPSDEVRCHVSEVKRIGSTGWLIDRLLRRYEDGQIKGLLIQVLNKDGTFSTSRAGELSYLEMMGLLESAKDDFRVVQAENIQ